MLRKDRSESQLEEMLALLWTRMEFDRGSHYSDDGKHWYIVFVGLRCLYRVCDILAMNVYTVLN